MKWMVLGGDLRFAYLAAYARSQGQDVKAVGFERAELPDIPHGTLAEVCHADAVVMMDPFVRGVVWPYGIEAPESDALFNAISPGTHIMMFGACDERHNVFGLNPITNLLDDEAFVLENAHMSAEGAVCSVMSKSMFSLYKTDVIVVGFGRIGAALTKILIGLGARVTVAARRENSRARARMFGARSITMEELENAIGNARVIYTTPPETVIEENMLKTIRRDAFLVELASPPYGFDMKLAHSLGVNAWLEPGIPGKYCPESAGAALYRCVMACVKSGAGDKVN